MKYSVTVAGGTIRVDNMLGVSVLRCEVCSMPSQCGMRILTYLMIQKNRKRHIVALDNFLNTSKVDRLRVNRYIITDYIGGNWDWYLQRSKLPWVRTEPVYNPNSGNNVFLAYFDRTPENSPAYRGLDVGAAEGLL